MAELIVPSFMEALLYTDEEEQCPKLYLRCYEMQKHYR